MSPSGAGSGVGKAARNRSEERKQEFGFVFVKCAGWKGHRGQMLVGRMGDAAPKRGYRRPGLGGSTEDVQGSKTIPVKLFMEVCPYIFVQTHGIYNIMSKC